MAKKKVVDVEGEKLDTLASSITEKYGDGVFLDAKDILDEKQIIIPVSPAIDLAIGGGVPEGSWFGFTGAPKTGKAQPLDSIVMTPKGPVKMGDLKVGDEICDPDGFISHVTGIYPQGKKLIYRIEFSNMDNVECCEDHLWRTRSIYSKSYYVQSLREFGDNIKTKDKGRPRFYIDLPKPLHFHEQHVEIEPYLMGLLLGDGCFRDKVMFTNIDEELVNYFKIMVEDADHKVVPTGPCSYNIARKYGHGTNKYREILKKYGLFDHLSLDKFIPNQYKYNSVEVRRKIVSGLLDTDGSISKKGDITYYSSSDKLASDFKEIIESLGGFCLLKRKKTKCGGKEFKSWICHVRLPDFTWCFNLDRKKARIKTRQKRPFRRLITNVTPIGEKECQCISTDHHRGLYLTNHCIETHNTSTSLHFARNAQKEEYGGRKIFFISVEGRLKKRDIRLPGFDLDRFKIVRSNKDRILSVVDFLNITLDIMKSEPGCVIIVDSFSSLSHQKELTEGLGTSTRGGTNVILTQFCNEVGNILPINKNILIGITHIIANTSGYGPSTYEKGGSAIAYQADVKLHAKSIEFWRATASDPKPVGQIVKWNVKCTALDAPPGQEVISYIRYGQGIDEIMELTELGVDTGLIEKKGAWFQWEDQKFQGQEKVRAFFEQDMEARKVLESKLKGMLC